MCAVQGIEARAPLVSSAPLRAAMKLFRQSVPSLKEDRYMADDLTAAAAVVLDGTLAKAANVRLAP